MPKVSTNISIDPKLKEKSIALFTQFERESFCSVIADNGE